MVSLLLHVRRDFKSIFIVTESITIPRGVNIAALDKKIKYPFYRVQNGPRKGDHVSAGDIFGEVQENSYACDGDDDDDIV